MSIQSDTGLNMLSNDDFSLFMKKDNLSSLEKAVINNNFDLVYELLTSGSKNYYENKFCNGYLNKYFENNNHTTCLNNICFKTSTYFALILNYGITRTLHCLLNILSSKDNFSEKITNKIKDVCSDFCKFNCHCKEYYDYTNVYLVNNDEILKTDSDTFIKLKEIAEYLYSFTGNDSDEYEFPDINNFSEIFNFDCFHNYHDINMNFSDIYTALKDLCYIYEINYTILKLLLNEQIYEYMTNLLDNDSINDDKIFDFLDKFYNNNLIDINYVNPYEKRTVLLNILYKKENVKLINKMFSLGSKLPDNINSIIYDLLSQKSSKSSTTYNMVDLLLNNATASDLLTPKNILLQIIESTSMPENTMYKFLECICNKENMYYTNDVLIKSLNSSNSFDLINFFSKYKKFFDNCDLQCIEICLLFNKYLELDILLTNINTDKFINGNDEYSPLFSYFDKHIKLSEEFDSTPEFVNSVKTLEVLLKYKPNVNIIRNNTTCLLQSVKNNKFIVTKILLENGADPFIIDNLHKNSLHYAILHNDHNLIKLLLNCSKMDSESKLIYLVNEVDEKGKTPLMLALDSSEPIDITHLLFTSNNNVKLDVSDNDGMRILDLIVINDELTIDTKIKLFNIYFSKGINLTEVNKSDFKPIVVRAVEYDLFELVVMIMDKLIKNSDIEVGASDIITGIKNNTVSNITVKDKHNPNFYSLVIMYIKQNFHKTVKINHVPQKKSNNITKSIDNDSENINKLLQNNKITNTVINISEQDRKNLIDNLKDCVFEVKNNKNLNSTILKYILTTVFVIIIKYYK